MAGETGTSPGAAQARTNTGHYMKSAMISLFTLTIVQSGVNYMLGKEEPIACHVGVNDNHWDTGRYQSIPMFDPKSAVHTSQYVAMKDGIELAVDSYVAKSILDSKEQVPTIIHYTRHGRGYQVDFPFNFFTQYKKGFVNPRTNVYIQRFVSTGFAWVVAEIRGTGVSYGTKEHDFSEKELEDGRDLIDWIIQQPWSNGQVGAFGHGIDGASALLLAATQHPALKAMSLNSVPLDFYDSVFFPGGVPNTKAIEDFSSFTMDLDLQKRWGNVPTLKPRLLMKYFGGNVYPVPSTSDSSDSSDSAKLIHAHRQNPNLTSEFQNVVYKDDILPKIGKSFEQSYNLERFLPKIAESKVASYSFAGYYDAAIAKSALSLYTYLSEHSKKEKNSHRLTLGPWSHAGVDNGDPFAQSKQKCFWHLDEISRFFDYHLYPNRQQYTQLDQEDSLHYYSLVHSKWKSTNEWPPFYMPKEKKNFFFGLNQSMEEVNTPSGQEEVVLDFFFHHTSVSRWDIMGHLFSNRPFYYHDRTGMEEKKRFVSFMTIPLSISEIVGEAELNLFFSIDQPNVHLFAYLEDVDLTPAFSNENKRKGITYITEAIWNPIHHGHTNSTSLFFKKNARPEKIKPNTVYEATFKFQPIAYVLKRNHQLRVSIGLTSYQKDFTTSSQLGATKLTIHFGGKYPSALKIPLYDVIY